MSRQILVIDDDDDLRDTVRLILGLEGFDVIGCRDGVEALEWLRTNAPPAAILLDLRMPRMSGAEFVASLRAEPGRSKIPIALLSGDATCKDAAEAMGVHEYLMKPVDLDALVACVVRLAGQPALPVEPPRP